MVRSLLVLILCVFQGAMLLHAQEEDESCLPPDKKTLKLLDKAKATPAPERYKLFSELTKLAPDHAMVYFEYAMLSFEEAQQAYSASYDPSKGDKLMIKTKGLFEKTAQLCDDYHADMYYYLGAIEYLQQDKVKATEYFRKFLDFKSTTDSRFPKDYAQKKKEVEKIIGETKKEVDLLVNKVPFDPKIVKNVSTNRDEFFPMISPDNELMFYTRRVDRTNKGDLISRVVEEFTMSRRDDARELFDGGRPLPLPFNDGTFESYGASTVSVDNKEMIICACKWEKVQGQDYKNCDLYVTTYAKTKDGSGNFIWSNLENLGPNINTKDGWEGQPSLSADGNVLYFTAVRPNTRKDDIFYSKRNADGSWGLAMPLTDLNTPGKDKSPFLHQDSQTLYFVSEVSDQRNGIGGLDIFWTQMGEDGKWSTPKNIGYPINTEEDEIGLFVSTDGKEAYFSSRQKGVWNIYSFELYKEARPNAVVLIKGELKDAEGEPVKDATIEIAYSNTEKVETVKVSGEDGKYAAVVRVKDVEDVMVTVKKEGHAFDSKLIKKEELTKETFIKEKDLEVRKLEVGMSYTINDILYATNSADLSGNSKFILKQFARFLKENPSIKVSILGHTDDVGDDQLNLLLSQNRARGVKDYLVSLGITSNRLKFEGFGETKPRVPNDSEANRALNRRTEFVIDAL